MTRTRLIVVGVVGPLLLALVTTVLFALGFFPDDSSKTLALVAIIGGVLAGVLILVFALLQISSEYLDRHPPY